MGRIYVAESAVLVGDVSIGEDSSVWHYAVLRADLDAIVIGKGSNIQDHCTLHVDKDQPIRIGNGVVVGHGAIVHGCVIEDSCTIGMGAIITSGAHIGKHSYVGAGAVVTENTKVPPGSIVLGVPGKVKGPASEEHIARIRRGAEGYVKLARKSLPARPVLVGSPSARLDGAV